MANIGTFNNENGAIFQDNSVTVQQNQQNNLQAQQPAATGQGGKDSSTREVLIRRNKKEICTKVDLFRIIMAMYKIGCFESTDNSRLTQDKVFTAFGNMLGEDFSNYSNDLSSGRNKKNAIDIFKRLEDAFLDYEKNIENKKMARM